MIPADSSLRSCLYSIIAVFFLPVNNRKCDCVRFVRAFSARLPYPGRAHTSTQPLLRENRSSSGSVSSTALAALPAAG